LEQKVATQSVFLVEDSPLLRERLEAMLRALPGTTVIGHATEAEAAVQAILADPPDAVVLDIQLAKGSGFDVLRAVHERAPQVAFYVLTNFANDAYRAAAERLGARGFFDKSTEFEHLRDALAARAA
jgi:two-component system, NarL family, response regulator DevR